MFRRWIAPAGVRSGATLTLSQDTPARGAGTELLLSYADVWPGRTAIRAIIERDDSFPRGDKSISRRLVMEYSQLAPTLESRPATTTSPAEGIAKWLADNQIQPGEFEMFTDGSWKDNTPWMQHIFHGSNPADTVASASVVCLPTGPD